jgi:uncharacterized protein DUF3443
MKSRKLMGFAMAVAILASLTGARAGFAAANNVMNANVTHGVNGAGADQIYGAVKVCVPGSTIQCETVSGLLIDTGSFGLRIFAQALTVALPVQMSGPSRIAECAFFGTFTTWGRVATADVKLGGEPMISNVPVQVINANFPVAGARPAACNGLIAQNPRQLNFNGILGVGLKRYDGEFTDYYACTTTSCNPSTIVQPLANQVQNPVAMLPGNPANGNIPDDNGVMLRLALPPSTGAPTLTGQLYFGVNTQADNQIPAGFTVYMANPSTLTFSTTFRGRAGIPSFLDSGSNGFFYDNPNLPTCLGGWYCPSFLFGQKATNTEFGGGNSGVVNFNIDNALGLFLTGNAAFSDLGANTGPEAFDWGLPFFFGRRVFIGIQGKTITGVAESTPLWIYK